MRQILHSFITLELFPRKRLHLLASAGNRNLIRGSDNSAIEGKHALTLEEMVEVEEGFAGSTGSCLSEDGGKGTRLCETADEGHSLCGLMDYG